MISSRTILLLCLLFFQVGGAERLFAQDSLVPGNAFRSGIAAQFGFGHLALRDEHISGESYSGPISRFAVTWSHYHETYGFQLGLEYAEARHLKNYNVSGESNLGGLTLADVYPVGSLDLLGKEASLFLGPRMELFIYYRRQHIAQNPDATPDIYESDMWLASLGITGGVAVLLSPEFQVDASGNLGLLSLGGGTVSDASSVTGLTLLTPFAAARCTAGIGIDYLPSSWLAVRVGYGVELTNIKSWNRILMVSDNLLLTLGFTF
ncbi:MAG: hypothetical protein WB699_02520 [Bacteroidota bacterium]